MFDDPPKGRKWNCYLKWRDEVDAGLRFNGLVISAGVLCGAHGLFGGSEKLIGVRIFLPAINVIYKATPGLLSDMNWPLRS